MNSQFTFSDSASTDGTTNGPAVTEAGTKATSAGIGEEATTAKPSVAPVEVIVVQSWSQATDLGVEFYVNVEGNKYPREKVDQYLRDGQTELQKAFGTTVWRQSHVKQGLYSLRRHRLISIGIPIINLKRSSDRLRFIMGIPIPVRRRLLCE